MHEAIKPIYDDVYFRTYEGELMQVKGKALTGPLVKGWLLELMQAGKDYTADELYDLVTQSHAEAGGNPSRSTTERTRKQQVFSALADLRKIGQIHQPQYGFWAMGATEGAEEISTAEDAEQSAQAQAEIMVGEGPQVVYGWYLPAYKELASIKGHNTWPMKVGRTSSGDPENRMNINAPERPRQGFVARVNNSGNWERMFHSFLDEKGRHLPDAMGTEWFMTNPEELRTIYHALTELINGDEDND